MARAAGARGARRVARGRGALRARCARSARRARRGLSGRRGPSARRAATAAGPAAGTARTAGANPRPRRCGTRAPNTSAPRPLACTRPSREYTLHTLQVNNITNKLNFNNNN